MSPDRTKNEDPGEPQLRFYGIGDLATYWQIGEAAEVVRAFEVTDPPTDVVLALKLYNASQFIEAGLVPESLDEAGKAELVEKGRAARGSVARFFTSIDAGNCRERVAMVPQEYQTDLLTLLGNNRAYERCSPRLMLNVLSANGIPLRELLGNRKLVREYDAELRGELLSDPQNAEILIWHHFAKDRGQAIYLPSSFDPADAHSLMSRYIDGRLVNPNHLGLIETAPISPRTGVDATLKLAAKRRRAREIATIFEGNKGMESGASVRVSDGQLEPVLTSAEGMVANFSYSRSWLESTIDAPSVLNNFQHLFRFSTDEVLLTLPAYPSELGVFERYLSTSGQSDYQTGVAYRVQDAASTLQTQLAQTFLASHEVDLESVVAWFFHDYLPQEFDAMGFSFTTSARNSSFLEKTRHLLVEMESVLRQFTLFVRHRVVDRELLSVSSDNLRFREIPSLVDNKYLYASEHPEVQGILHALFSDQSGLTYISDDQRGTSLADLLIRNEVAYEEFLDHQRETLDRLISLGVLNIRGGRLQPSSVPQFLLLRSLFAYEAASFPHLDEAGRNSAADMTARGWLRGGATLLTLAEASYFNYQLNQAEFGNGPQLRNRYLHGLQDDREGSDVHYGAYLTTLKLLVALVIKVNDDFASYEMSIPPSPAPRPR